ncbi:SWI5-dependent HO expression protein 3-like [Poecilia formosa]|uniref:SWI5-dependent HO expression protein 3-like n=1 Tax=Poecilia formosa TaxID=48698 RepID=UPI0007B9DE5B|nr:PREDICTED: SWI5-dependent HO expression protein 3-like [Poecilia formosa]
MAIKVFFLAVLFRLANSQLPYIRTCDPVPKVTTQTPTVCSNYENIKYIYEGQESLRKTVSQLKMSVESNNAMLMRLERTLNNSLAELTRATESQSSAIQSLRRDVNKLENHQERVGGNFSEIEQRLDITEKKLTEKKAKLESLETKTEVAFENMNTLLNTYKDELSHLNSKAHDLEVQLEGQLNVTKVDLEEKLDVIEKNTEAISTKLHNQKTELDHRITSRFNKVIHELETQNATMNHLIGQTAGGC